MYRFDSDYQKSLGNAVGMQLVCCSLCDTLYSFGCFIIDLL